MKSMLESGFPLHYILFASGKGRQASLLRAEALIARSHFLIRFQSDVPVLHR
jgi:hypothetical protein